MDHVRVILTTHGLNTHLPVRRVSHNSINEVDLIGDAYVIKRYGTSPGHPAIKEARLCRTLQVRALAPEVIATGTVGGREYLLTRMIPGEPVAAYWEHLLLREQAILCSQLGGRLAAIHSFPRDSVLGAIVPPQTPVGDRVSTVLAMLADRDLLTSQQRSGVQRYFASHLADGRAGLDGLLHGGYRFGNIVGQGAALTGIVDWEDAVFGNIREELSLVLYRTIPTHLHESFLRGYQTGVSAPGLPERLAYALLYYLTFLPEIGEWSEYPGKQSYYRRETDKILKETIGG